MNSIRKVCGGVSGKQLAGNAAPEMGHAQGIQNNGLLDIYQSKMAI